MQVKVRKVKPWDKRKKKVKVKNYRGLTLINPGYNLYTEIKGGRLEVQLKKGRKLNNTQCVLSKESEISDAIYTLKESVRRKISKVKVRYGCSRYI